MVQGDGDVTRRMREDWDRRARENARYYINTREHEGFEFGLSGCVSVVYLLRPIQHLLRHDMRLLEIGCGIGRMMPFFAGLFAEAHGIDISPSMVEQGRARLGNHPNVHLHLGDGRSLAGLPDHWFDVVVSFEVFQHVPDREVIADYVHEAFRVLKPGGIARFLVKTKRWDGQGDQHDTWCGVELGREDLDAWLRRDPWRLEAAHDSDDPSKAWVLLSKPAG